jgi:hypothetical protein
MTVNEYSQRPETELHRIMRENCKLFLICAAIAGLGFSVLFTDAKGLGVNVPVYAAMLLLCFRACFIRLGIWDGRKTALYTVGTMLLALSTCMTVNSFVQFVNILGIVILLCMLILSRFCDTEAWQFGKYFSSFIRLVFTAIAGISEPLRHLSGLRKSGGAKKGKALYIIIGLLISIPLCAVVISLLMSADMVFSRLLHRLFGWMLNLPDVLSTLLRALLLFLIAFFGFYCALAGQAEKPVPSEIKAVRRHEPLVAVTFTGILAFIYVVFCAIQVIYLFIGGGELPEHMSYSEYARQGFFQLLFVSMFNVALVVFSAWKFGRGRALRVLLTVISACTYILIASSAFRMYLYADAYGLTFLRLLVFWFLFVLTILMSGTVVSVCREGFNLFRFSLVACLVLWLCFSFAKPDRIAAGYNARRFGMTDDTVSNMIYDLSMDAVPVMSEYGYEGAEFREEWDGYLGSSVKKAYERHGVRGFNFSLREAVKSVE